MNDQEFEYALRGFVLTAHGGCIKCQQTMKAAIAARDHTDKDHHHITPENRE